MDIVSFNGSNAELSSRIRRKSDSVAHNIAVLSSGNRIQRAKDDVAALSISTGFSARISTMRTITRGMAEAASLLQIAETGQRNIQDALLRMKAVSVMAYSGSVSSQERHFLNLEFQQLKAEIDRIANTTNFNGIPLLNRKSIPYDPLPVPGETVTGTLAGESVEGSLGDDTIDPGFGNDTVYGGDGSDIINSTGLAPGLQGSIYASAVNINTLAQAETLVAAAPAPDATFTATDIDYPNGTPPNTATGTVGNFLGVDGASISAPALLPSALNRMVFVFDGYLYVTTAGPYSFTVGSDDGFQLDIDGAMVTDYPNLRGFANTTGNAVLGAGYHTIRLIYWENLAQEGLRMTSSLTGGATVGVNVLLSASGNGQVDGNDRYDGGSGKDIVTFDGNRSDYSITEIGAFTFQITDNRPGSPNGTDILTNVEIARFADEDYILDPTYDARQLTRPIIQFIISEEGSKTLDIDLLPVTLDEIFTDPDSLNVLTAEAAAEAQEAVDSAVDIVASRRAYAGSKQAQTDIISTVTELNMRNEDFSRAVLADADITNVSTQFAQALVQQDMAVSLAAQTNRLRSETILDVIQRGRDATRQMVTGVPVTQNGQL